jgi:hypothetical protein
VEINPFLRKLDVNFLTGNNCSRRDLILNLSPQRWKYIRWIIALPPVEPAAGVHRVHHVLSNSSLAGSPSQESCDFVEIFQLDAEQIGDSGAAHDIPLISFENR